MNRSVVHLRLVGSPGAVQRTRPDPLVDAALSALQRELTRAWTVSALAKQLGVSRPVLARRFRAAEGTSPMRKLARLRMERAAELLRSSERTLAEVAEQVGYRSEFAFNRAFKRHHQTAPGGYRRARFTMRAAA